MIRPTNPTRAIQPKAKKILNDLFAKISSTTNITPRSTTWPKSFCKKAIINTTTKNVKK